MRGAALLLDSAALMLAAKNEYSDIQKLTLTPPPNHLHIYRRPVPQRGVSGSSETLGTGCGGRGSARAHEVMAGRVLRPVSDQTAR